MRKIYKYQKLFKTKKNIKSYSYKNNVINLVSWAINFVSICMDLKLTLYNEIDFLKKK
jgi:hypothetical protein